MDLKNYIEQLVDFEIGDYNKFTLILIDFRHDDFHDLIEAVLKDVGKQKKCANP